MNADELHRLAALRTARRQTLATAWISLASDVVGAVIVYHVVGWDPGNGWRAAHALIAAAVLLLLARWPTASERVVVVLYLVVVVPVLPLLVVWALAVPEARQIEPFVAQKMVLMGVALLTPASAALGLALTGVVVGEAVVLSALRLAGARAGEPWVTLFYGLFAVGLLLHRGWERRLSTRLVHLEAQATALERTARESLEVRDRLNSPLQTLELGLDMMRQRARGDDEELARIARLQSSVDRLKRLSRLLAHRSSPPGPDDGDEPDA